MTVEEKEWAEELLACIQFLHQKGFAPATSSNYSFRLPEAEALLISQSGVDKGNFKLEHLLKVDLQGKPLEANRKPSAETLLHCMIYEQAPQSTCVLHTHTVYNTTLSYLLEEEGWVTLEGFEVLKGLEGIHTHESLVEVPIFPNSQDIASLAKDITKYWLENPDMKAFLLAGHGLYTWGKDIASAKRQVEVFEFLFECFYKINTFK